MNWVEGVNWFSKPTCRDWRCVNPMSKAFFFQKRCLFTFQLGSKHQRLSLNACETEWHLGGIQIFFYRSKTKHLLWKFFCNSMISETSWWHLNPVRSTCTAWPKLDHVSFTLQCTDLQLPADVARYLCKKFIHDGSSMTKVQDWASLQMCWSRELLIWGKTIPEDGAVGPRQSQGRLAKRIYSLF